jgi:hypothetical protein
MNIINDITSRIAKQTADKIDEWCFSNWVTIENAKKFKMKIKYWTPEYVRTLNSITAKSTTEYTLYPARWRNAKKPISTLTI